MGKFPFYNQLDAKDCGPTCLRMVAAYYGRNYSLESLRKKSYISREGVSLLGLSDAAEKIGLRSAGVRLSYQQLLKEKPFPCVIHWQQKHFVVVYKIKKDKIYIANPAKGLLCYSKKEFIESWISSSSDGSDKGICLILSVTPEFYDVDGEPPKKNMGFLFSYIRPYKKYFLQLFLGILAGSMLQLMFPFLTQAVVDYGIGNNDIGFVYLVLIAQITLYISYAAIHFIRSWILLHVNSRIGISMVSDFLARLLKLPLSFYDNKLLGDIMKRVDDHNRVEKFLTSSGVNIVFSIINILLFSAVLAYYNWIIFVVVILGISLYASWVLLFLKKRKQLDYMTFDHSSKTQSLIVNFVNGIQDIKLNNCEKQKRWEWERIQAKLFHVREKGLANNQYQSAGSVFIHQLKDIIISFIAAKSVIDGSMTLGMMMAVQYIIGQVNAPVNQMLTLVHSFQDMKISLERIGELRDEKEEENIETDLIEEIPANEDIVIENLSFRYEGPHAEPVLTDVSVRIESGKTTAIVGSSGSGKTTLMKLLLGFYLPDKGRICLNGVSLNEFSNKQWRAQCGAVMQDGYVFTDTIARNIALGDEDVDKQRLLQSVIVANIRDFIESLPLRYNTKIGEDGHGLSQGQKQRILIARAVYKNPEYFFFDEATSSLDAGNEKIVTDNIEKNNEGKTSIVVAHRLSTVKNAHKIIVLEKGKIAEEGSHEELTKNRGIYYHLVKNQLELGS